MKTIISLSIAIAFLTVSQVKAQENSATQAVKKERAGQGTKNRATGQLSNDATQNGNAARGNTQVMTTEGSTSQGTASTPAPGGATGTNVRRVVQKAPAKASTASTSGKTGSDRPTTTAAAEKEARTSDKNVSTGHPEVKGMKQPGNATTPRAKVQEKTIRGKGQRPGPQPGIN